jgi:hypothetical protein
MQETAHEAIRDSKEDSMISLDELQRPLVQAGRRNISVALEQEMVQLIAAAVVQSSNRHLHHHHNNH